MFAEFANEIKDKLSFQEMIKESTQNPCMDSMYKNDQKFQFYKMCNDQNVHALPILFKIQNKRLILNEYTLNKGLCESIRDSFRLLPECINQISLTQNGLKDS